MTAGHTCSSRSGTNPAPSCSTSPELVKVPGKRPREKRHQMSDRFFPVSRTLPAVLFILVMPGQGGAQAFYSPSTPKFPQAKTWIAQKAKLPPYTAPRTPDGVPDLQGV